MRGVEHGPVQRIVEAVHPVNLCSVKPCSGIQVRYNLMTIEHMKVTVMRRNLLAVMIDMAYSIHATVAVLKRWLLCTSFKNK